MEILNDEIKLLIESDIIATAFQGRYDAAISGIANILDELYN